MRLPTICTVTKHQWTPIQPRLPTEPTLLPVPLQTRSTHHIGTHKLSVHFDLSFENKILSFPFPTKHRELLVECNRFVSDYVFWFTVERLKVTFLYIYIIIL